ncbi:uncharacterized protein LOC136028610 [Artemia franciscana]|uniref:uncharacterized protein LOC136028610 n=1 Tax=Artemia franciscana TaxID=6661 RepID=UPI0032DB87EB
MDSEIQSYGPCCRTPTSEHSVEMATQTDDRHCSKRRQHRRPAPHITNKKKSQGVLNDAELRMRSLQSSDEDQSLASGRIMVVVEKKSRNITPVNGEPEKPVWTNNECRDQPDSLNSTMTELKDSGISEVNIPINSCNSTRSQYDNIESNCRTESEASSTRSYNAKVGSKQDKALHRNKKGSNTKNTTGKNVDCGWNYRQVYRVEAINGSSKHSNRSPNVGRDKRNHMLSPKNLKPLTERSDDTGTLSSTSRPHSNSDQRSKKSLMQNTTETCENPKNMILEKTGYCLGKADGVHEGLNISQATDVSIDKSSSIANCEGTKSADIHRVPECKSRPLSLHKRKECQNGIEKNPREGTFSCERGSGKVSSELNKTVEEERKIVFIPNRQGSSKIELHEEKPRLNKDTDGGTDTQGLQKLEKSIVTENSVRLSSSLNKTDWGNRRSTSPQEDKLSDKFSSRRNSAKLNRLTKEDTNMIKNPNRPDFSENELNKETSILNQKRFGNQNMETTTAENHEKETLNLSTLQFREKWTKSPNFVTSSPVDCEFFLEENIVDEHEAIDEEIGPILSASPCVSADIKEKLRGAQEKSSNKEETLINYHDNSATHKQCYSESLMKLHFRENGEKIQSPENEKETAPSLNSEIQNDNHLGEISGVIIGPKVDQNTESDITKIEIPITAAHQRGQQTKNGEEAEYTVNFEEEIPKGNVGNYNQNQNAQRAYVKETKNSIIEEAAGKTYVATVNPKFKEGFHMKKKSPHKQNLTTVYNKEKHSKIPKPQRKKSRDRSQPTLSPIHRYSDERSRLAERTLPSFDRTNAIMTPVENRYHNCSRKPPLPVSVTLANQIALRRYHTERRIFQQLLDLKQMQMRSHRANEAVLVKRLLDGFNKVMPEFGLRRYNGQYLFKPLEKFLFDQLRLLQTKQGHQILENCPIETNTGVCSHSTHKSHHAAHAYAGLPCSVFCRSNNSSRASVLPVIR